MIDRLEGLTKFGAASAVNIEGEIASATNAAVDTQIGKHQTISAELLTKDKVFALVVTVALEAVGENTVLFRAVTVSCLSVDYKGRNTERENDLTNNPIYTGIVHSAIKITLGKIKSLTETVMYSDRKKVSESVTLIR